MIAPIPAVAHSWHEAPPLLRLGAPLRPRPSLRRLADARPINLFPTARKATMSVPATLHNAIAKHKASLAENCALLLPPKNKLRKFKARILTDHAANIHAWCCLEYAIETGVQPVSTGWDALRLGYIPDDWVLPARFPGSAKAT